ncbi:aspartate kinase [Coccomyxa subellipsoidea C-169]|uniref:Aspartokinase n=1 Tax=Coccomyxa subellipsoidea (strain C-169) TaxID=574566 RepID=I0Z626_COCSC|nr:aspartate kinase [Coccomyxa subellipsoidea C-169]EIE26095.1 aspartate kinase [Coccomyxa subellipsoidea C-169]|eukprot:XP_005650639.1 aspartate kinase [Coccomyxa subellipsoidea C-169]
MKFGGSSLASAERMKEVASIICSFPDQYPCVVLSAMGKTTNLLLQAGAEALKVAPGNVPSLAPLRTIRELHRRTARDLGFGAREDIESLLSEVQQLLVGISIMQELTPRAQDSLVSFGERLSTRVFASFLRSQGIAANQHDAFSIGMTTTDDFQNAEVVYQETLPAIKASLTRPPGGPKTIPVVTGFLGRGMNTGAITTLGRGGSDLTATVIGAALGVEEVQVWKDVDGVLTTDPRIVSDARPVPLLTYEEASELAFFGATVLHPSAMQPALQTSNLDVRVKNSYNRMAAGTLICRERDMTNVLMTSIVLKTNVTLLDIVSTRMLGQYGFLSKVFDVFRDNEVSVDVVATSEISVSLTLDPSKIWDRELIEEEIEALMSAFSGFAKVSCTHNVSIISLICNVARTSNILERVFRVLGRQDVNVKMMSQGASKTNISLIVSDSEAKQVVRALHDEFFAA